VVKLEAGLREHRFEDVEAQLQLAPVMLPVDALVGGPLDVFAHYADATVLRTVTQPIGQTN